MEQLWQKSARALASALARGEITAVDAVDAHIARIEAVNPALNAVCWKRYDEARAEARAADQRRAAGEPLGPLHGVPITVKECLDLAGTPSTFGIPGRAGLRADADDVYVARLRRAGAIVLGKTNVAQLLFFLETDNPVYGRTQNPHDPLRSSGGSSGGQAAIIAAGGSAIGLGTDLGGSSRVPAAFCGIVGLKPTAGRLPDAGRWSAPIGQRAIVSQVGVLGRDVADAALALEVANGGRDPQVEPPMPLGDPATVDVSGLRVGFWDQDGSFAAAPACRRAVHDAAAILARAGARVAAWTPPALEEAVALGYGIFSAGGSAFIGRALGKGRRDPRIKDIEMGAGVPAALRPVVKRLLGLGGRRKKAGWLDYYGHTHTDAYWHLVERQMDYQERWRRALDDAGLDVVLSPACALPALRHGASVELGLLGAYTIVYNVLGYPAGVVPVTRVGKDEESDRPPSRDKMDTTARATEEGSAGLPVAVQVVARPFREHVALAAMAAIERGAPQDLRAIPQ
jgi:fatty acid amide hydrolase